MDSGTGLLGNFLTSSLGEPTDLHAQLMGSDPTSILGVPPAHLEGHRSLTPTQLPGTCFRLHPGQVPSSHDAASLCRCKDQKYFCYFCIYTSLLLSCLCSFRKSNPPRSFL